MSDQPVNQGLHRILVAAPLLILGIVASLLVWFLAPPVINLPNDIQFVRHSVFMASLIPLMGGIIRSASIVFITKGEYGDMLARFADCYTYALMTLVAMLMLTAGAIWNAIAGARMGTLAFGILAMICFWLTWERLAKVPDLRRRARIYRSEAAGMTPPRPASPARHRANLSWLLTGAGVSLVSYLAVYAGALAMNLLLAYCGCLFAFFGSGVLIDALARREMLR